MMSDLCVYPELKERSHPCSKGTPASRTAAFPLDPFARNDGLHLGSFLRLAQVEPG